MSEVFEIRSAAGEDLEKVTDLIRTCGLPTGGVEEHLGHGYVVAEGAGEIIGTCGVEVYGQDGLLRSVAVCPSSRGRSVGRAMVSDRIAWARAQGVRALYLLTTDAGDYFERFGFSRIERDGVPAGVKTSLEFTSLCPETAVALVKPLGGHKSEKSEPPGKNS